MRANIEISEANLKESATLLNILLADEYVLYTKTRNAHWNVQGSGFYELHKFFEDQYNELAEIIDEVAERVRMLGHFALGTMKDFLAVTRMSESNYEFTNQQQIIKTLLDDHETIIHSLRSDAMSVADKHKDIGSSDFLTGMLERHEKMAWMLRAHLS
ncbi:MAG: DNA starvation/stationary phase protection protein [Bacteroidales bacterium]|nr:DNA starvation/stationary phase protection protein [Bacteroidales bacterium]